MPLNQGARALIVAHLQKIENRERVLVIEIGTLTRAQHDEINNYRNKFGLPPLELPTILYLGKHHYESRIVDGYTIEDMASQIESGLCDHSVVVAGHRMMALQNKTGRQDGYGNSVKDLVILEITSRRPRSEAFSAIPKGDSNKPPRKNKNPS